MKIYLYHGTSIRNADKIMRHGFKDRVGSGKSNWEKRVESMPGFVYLTTAYSFFFAMNAAKGKNASIIKVEVDTDDLFPDEDMFYFKYGNTFKITEYDIEQMQHLSSESLRLFGNVSARPEAIKVVGRKDFNVVEMSRFSDPSISPMNYKLLGEYYRTLTDKWFSGEDWETLNSVDFLMQKTA